MKFRLIITPLIILASLLLLVLPAAAQFNPLDGACKNAPSNPACQQNQTQNGSKTNPGLDIIKTATNIIALVAGVGAVIVIIISGIMFVTAGGVAPGQRAGDPNRIKSARSTLTGAIVGLIIIALAWTIITFVTDKLIK